MKITRNLQIHRNFEQHSDEWFEMKRGKMSGSNADKIMSTRKNSYVDELITQHFLWHIEPSYTSKDMQRGTDLEPVARELYEKETLTTVEEVGLITIDDYTCYSPDGLVGDDGLIEIKCRNAVIHKQILLSNEPHSADIDQLQFGLAITGRKWIDYVHFNPDFVEGLQLVIIRVYPDEVWQEAFWNKHEKAIEQIKTEISILNQIKNGN